MLASTFPGCSAWATASDMFAVYINGVDYSDAAHNTAGASITIEGLSISTSLDSNAQAAFTIEDPARGVTIPAWGDVVIWFAPSGTSSVDHLSFQADAFQNDAFDTTAATAGAGRILFSGLVTGQDIMQEALGRRIVVRATDYGILLDRHPSATITPLRFTTAAEAIQSVPVPGPITNVASTIPYVAGDGRVQASRASYVELKYLSDDTPYVGYTDTLTGSPRSLLTSVAERIVRWQYLTPPYPMYVYVDPLRRLNVWGETGETAPTVLTDSATGTGPLDLRITRDYLPIETGVYVDDTAPAPSTPGMFVGDTSMTNGYLIAPGSISRNVGPGGWTAEIYGSGYLAEHGPAMRGTFEILTTDDWHVGQVVTITSAAHGLSASAFLITSVDWTFPGGATGYARVGISETASDGGTEPTFRARTIESGMRFNRNLLTRAGV